MRHRKDPGMWENLVRSGIWVLIWTLGILLAIGFGAALGMRVLE